MKYLKRMKNEGGFSLVELMVSVGIIGVMSSVAVPRYQKFAANAAQSEAQATLSSIYTLQTLYFTENSRYAHELTFEDTAADAYELDYPLPSDSRYEYKTASVTPFTQFKATAESKSKLASCAAAANDKWCVNQDKEMRNDGVAAAPCGTGDSAFGACS